MKDHHCKFYDGSVVILSLLDRIELADSCENQCQNVNLSITNDNILKTSFQMNSIQNHKILCLS
jgi:hypothetical protein